MKRILGPRLWMLLGTGMVLLQMTGCTAGPLEILNTIFLGITAAGSYAILQNL